MTARRKTARRQKTRTEYALRGVSLTDCLLPKIVVTQPCPSIACGPSLHPQGFLPAANDKLPGWRQFNASPPIGPARDTYDSLTGLISRDTFELLLSKTTGNRAARKRTTSLILVDLDHFQVVNDIYGRQAGDRLLIETVACLQSVIGAEAILARSDGDEYSIFLPNCSAMQAEIMAERIRVAIQGMQFFWHSERINVSASVGVVSISEFRSVSEALRAVDVACTAAKDKGHNRVQLYRSGDSELSQKIDEMAWVQRIRNALEQNRFCLYAQEIRSMDRSKPSLRHAELLLRLLDENGNIILPASFMPAAVRYGLMPLLDRWVIDRALSIIGRLAKSSQSVGFSSYAINLSGETVGEKSLVDYVGTKLAEHGVAPGIICFEITETSAVENIDKAVHLVKALKKLGCRFSLDDFGTGMSSYAYLKHLPVDYIKIDGSFIKEILHSKIDRAMVEMIVKMADVTNMAVIAECVENETILDALTVMNVGFAQGYAIGRPAYFDVA